MEDIIVTDFNKMLVRPCIVVSTISKNGVSNAAPFSFNSPATQSLLHMASAVR